MIRICHTGLFYSHLPYIINHYEHLSCFMQITTKGLHKL